MKRLVLLISAISFLTLTAHAEGPAAPFKGEAEAGAIVVSGASDSSSYAAKANTEYTQEKNVYTAFGHYIKANANGADSARNWDAGLRYDYQISELWSAFIGHKAESDIFAGYIQRDSTDLGMKYNILKSDSLSWFAELGYRYSKTQPVLGSNSYDSFGRLYTEVNKSFDKTLSFKYWAEYLPNFTDSKAFQFNNEASLNVMMNSIFSLRLAYLLQYQNQPPAGGKYSTTTTTMNLVAKF